LIHVLYSPFDAYSSPTTDVTVMHVETH